MIVNGGPDSPHLRLLMPGSRDSSSRFMEDYVLQQSGVVGDSVLQRRRFSGLPDQLC